MPLTLLNNNNQGSFSLVNQNNGGGFSIFISGSQETTTTTTTTTTTSTTTTTTTAATADLYVYAKYVNNLPSGFDELEYQVNAGSVISFGSPITSNSCQFFATITGLTPGDTVYFYTLFTSALSGDLSTCPAGASCSTPSITVSGGANYIYLTTDGGQSC